MTLPGETEAGSAGMQPCQGIAWWAHRDDVAGRGSSPFALCPKPYRIGRPLCLENPRPEGAEYSLTESAPSPFHAEAEQGRHVPGLLLLSNHALPHRAHEKGRPDAAQAPHTADELFQSQKTIFQRRSRRSEQQSQSNHEKIVRLSHLSYP